MPSTPSHPRAFSCPCPSLLLLFVINIFSKMTWLKIWCRKRLLCVISLEIARHPTHPPNPRDHDRVMLKAENGEEAIGRTITFIAYKPSQNPFLLFNSERNQKSIKLSGWLKSIIYSLFLRKIRKTQDHVKVNQYGNYSSADHFTTKLPELQRNSSTVLRRNIKVMV